MSCAAAVTAHGWPPTVTALSAAVVEKPWPCSVRVSPGLAEAVELFVSTGVMKSSWWKPQPPATRQANGAPPMLTISCRVSIGPGGGGEGGTGGGDGGGGDGGGEGGGGDGGAPGGAKGGGEGARRTLQSKQSVPYSQEEY